MADTTITGLNNLAPSTSTYVPISNGTTTGKALYNPIPVGGIIMWSGAVNSIPGGWALCNGQVVNGQTTPNLTNRFIVGAGNAYNPGNAGGSSTITPAGTVGGTVGNTTLTIAQIPAHNHAPDSSYIRLLRVTSPPTGTAASTDNIGNSQPDLTGTGVIQSVGGGGSHTHSFAGSFTGTSQASLPPYYALAYIMKVY